MYSTLRFRSIVLFLKTWLTITMWILILYASINICLYTWNVFCHIFSSPASVFYALSPFYFVWCHHFKLLLPCHVSTLSPFSISTLLITNLFYRLIVYFVHVLTYTITSSQVTDCKFFRHPVILYCFMEHFQEFLLNCQIVICYTQNSNSVFKFLLHLHFLLFFLFTF